MAKRIPCKVVKTALLHPDGDLLVARPHYSSPSIHTDNSVAHIYIHKADNLFAKFSRPAFWRGLAVGRADGGRRIIDYYA